MIKGIKIAGKVLGLLVAFVVVLALITYYFNFRAYQTWTPDYMEVLYGDTVVINQAHRGASAVAPENTLPAFTKAVDMGAHGIELDVVISKDEEIVVMHDMSLDRTTDGSGAVKNHTLPEIKQLDAGYWFGEEYSGTEVPTLQEVIDILPDDVHINIDIKNDSIFSGKLETGVVKIIAHNDLYHRVMVSSFDPTSLVRVKRADSRIPVALIYTANHPAPLGQGWFIPVIKPEALHPNYKMINDEYMEWAKTKGFRVNVWTVNDPVIMEEMLDMGVDGIITDYPDLLHEILLQRGM